MPAILHLVLILFTQIEVAVGFCRIELRKISVKIDGEDIKKAVRTYNIPFVIIESSRVLVHNVGRDSISIVQMITTTQPSETSRDLQECTIVRTEKEH